MSNIRWGILATGKIANALAWAIRDSNDGELSAVASRTQANAETFAEKWNIPRFYDTYEALAGDPEVDVIYIATPHSFHYRDMLMCLNAGKHVLCEKAFTLNAWEAEECIALARRKNLFLMEAMWMRFFPAMVQVRKWLADKLIGDIRLVQADFCLDMPYDENHRLYNMHLGGGALLDLGIYPLSFAAMVLGLPDRISSQAVLAPTGADELDAITFGYDNGALAMLSCSMRMERPREAFVVGTEGYIKVHDIFYCPDRLTLQRKGQPSRTLEFPYVGNGYSHEVAAVHACLLAGQTESDIMPLDETLELMRVMDRLRAEWGMVYPGEKKI